MSQLKNQIKEKALKCFMQFGFRSVTMDDLAKELGMSKKTLYQNFENKEDLLIEVLESCDETKKSHMEQLSKSAANPVEMVYLVFQYLLNDSDKKNPNYIYDLKKYYHQVWQKFIRGSEQFTTEKIILNLNAGKVAGLYRPEMNERIIAKMFYHKTTIFMDKDIFPEDIFLKKEIIREMLEYHLHGICTDKGRELIPIYTKKYFN